MERRIGGQTLDQPSPRIPVVHDNLDRHDAVRTGAVMVAGHDHCLVAAGQFRYEAPVGRFARDDPDARAFAHIRRALCQDDPSIRHLVRVRVAKPEHFGLRETGVDQGTPPHVRSSHGVARSEVVGETPPAVQLPEGEVQPILAHEVLEGE